MGQSNFGEPIAATSAPSSVSSSRPSLSKSSRPAAYTPFGKPKPASVGRGGTLRSVNWQSTFIGLWKATSMVGILEASG